MTQQRKTALALMVILALFAAAITTQMFMLHHREKRDGVLTEVKLSSLKDQIKADPKNEKAIAEARALDVQLRQAYFRTHRQYKVAAYLLIAAAIGFLLSANIFLAAEPQPLPDMIALNQGVPREVVTARARQGALAVGLLTALILIGFAGAGIVHRGDLPPVELKMAHAQPGGAATSATLAAAPTTATAIQVAAATPAATPEATPVPSPTATTTPAATATATPVVTSTPTATPSIKSIPSIQSIPPATSVSFKENWPNFRGPGNLGVAAAGAYPTEWSVKTKKNIAWSAAIPAEGKSSPIMWGDKIFLTGGDKTSHHVMAFDRASGKLLWDTSLKVPEQAAAMDIFEDTGFAAPTPATDGKYVYVLFASGLLAAVDFSGKQVWAKDLGQPDSQYGLASSLIMHEGTLITLLDQGPEAEAKKSKLVGFDPATGNEKWSTARPVPNSWASPSIIKSNGKYELITVANPLIISYDPASGKELWRFDGYGGEIAPSPAFDGERIIVANDSANSLSLKPGGSGDVTKTATVWKGEECLPDIPSPVAAAQRVLFARNSGEIGCFSSVDGKKIWEKSFESSVSASPIVAGTLVYLCCEDGITRIFELASAEYKQAGQGDLGEPVKATPALGDGRIYIRGAKHLFCIDDAGQSAPATGPIKANATVTTAPAEKANAVTSSSAHAPAYAPAVSKTSANATPAPTAKANISTSMSSDQAPVPTPASAAASTTSSMKSIPSIKSIQSIASTTATSAASPSAPTGAYKDNWPSFRGPGNIGLANAGDYPAEWNAKAKKNVPWVAEIPAEGKSSPIVWGDKVFLTGGDKASHHVMAFSRADGKLLWDTKLKVPPQAASMDVFEDTGFAASTPATDGKNVYVLFASGALAAVDFSGKPAWEKDLGLPDSQYGLASSLIVYKDTLIALLDQGPEAEAKKSKLVAYELATGKEKWSTARPVPNSWASPSIIKAGTHDELITVANPLVISYDPASGKELWRVDGYGGEIAPSPAFDGERVIVGNESAVSLAIKPGGSGDVTKSAVAWKGEECLPDIASPVAGLGRVLFVRTSGEFGCFNSADGKKIWEKSVEASFSASPILAGKNAYLCGQDGVTRVVDLTAPEYKEIARGDVGEPIHVTPAFADGRIYIRGSKHLFCIGARP